MQTQISSEAPDQRPDFNQPDVPYFRSATNRSDGTNITKVGTVVSPLTLKDLVYTVSETAFILKVSQKSVRRLIDRGLLDVSRGLRHIRIPRSSLEAYLKTTTEGVNCGARPSHGYPQTQKKCFARANAFDDEEVAGPSVERFRVKNDGTTTNSNTAINNK